VQLAAQEHAVSQVFEENIRLKEQPIVIIKKQAYLGTA
jgi:hypothetical protein